MEEKVVKEKFFKKKLVIDIKIFKKVDILNMT